MISARIVEDKQRKRLRILHWIARLAASFVFGVCPWTISQLSARYGWSAGHPSVWNLLGLIPVAAGSACIFWCMNIHFASGLKWGLAQNYLLSRGPYAFTRQPMYLSELALLLGWALFYGSAAVLIGFLIAVAVFQFFAVPLEERALEGRFGQAYREYKSKVPRWLV